MNLIFLSAAFLCYLMQSAQSHLVPYTLGSTTVMIDASEMPAMPSPLLHYVIGGLKQRLKNKKLHSSAVRDVQSTLYQTRHSPVNFSHSYEKVDISELTKKQQPTYTDGSSSHIDLTSTFVNDKILSEPQVSLEFFRDGQGSLKLEVIEASSSNNEAKQPYDSQSAQGLEINYHTDDRKDNNYKDNKHTFNELIYVAAKSPPPNLNVLAAEPNYIGHAEEGYVNKQYSGAIRNNIVEEFNHGQPVNLDNVFIKPEPIADSLSAWPGSDIYDGITRSEGDVGYYLPNKSQHYINSNIVERDTAAAESKYESESTYRVHDSSPFSTYFSIETPNENNYPLFQDNRESSMFEVPLELTNLSGEHNYNLEHRRLTDSFVESRVDDALSDFQIKELVKSARYETPGDDKGIQREASEEVRLIEDVKHIVSTLKSDEPGSSFSSLGSSKLTESLETDEDTDDNESIEIQYKPRPTPEKRPIPPYNSPPADLLVEYGGALHAATPDVTDKSTCSCGLRFASKIVGGSAVSIRDYPWMLGLVRVDSGLLFCGATLLTDRHAITAAHCVARIKPNELIVRGGQSERKGTGKGFEVAVKTISSHDRYTVYKKDYDVAILTFMTPIENFSPHILPVCLSTHPEPANWFRTGTVAGWGYTSENGELASKLQAAEVDLLTLAQCKSQSEYEHHYLSSRVMCARAKGKDACQGDSGGPLLVTNANHFEVIGVVSWGIGCAAWKYPGIYSNIHTYGTWIKAKIRGGTRCSVGAPPSIRDALSRQVTGDIRPTWYASYREDAQVDEELFPALKPSERLVEKTANDNRQEDDKQSIHELLTQSHDIYSTSEDKHGTKIDATNITLIPSVDSNRENGTIIVQTSNIIIASPDFNFTLDFENSISNTDINKDSSNRPDGIIMVKTPNMNVSKPNFNFSLGIDSVSNDTTLVTSDISERVNGTIVVQIQNVSISNPDFNFTLGFDHFMKPSSEFINPIVDRIVTTKESAKNKVVHFVRNKGNSISNHNIDDTINTNQVDLLNVRPPVKNDVDATKVTDFTNSREESVFIQSEPIRKPISVIEITRNISKLSEQFVDNLEPRTEYSASEKNNEDPNFQSDITLSLIPNFKAKIMDENKRVNYFGETNKFINRKNTDDHLEKVIQTLRNEDSANMGDLFDTTTAVKLNDIDFTMFDDIYSTTASSDTLLTTLPDLGFDYSSSGSDDNLDSDNDQLTTNNLISINNDMNIESTTSLDNAVQQIINTLTESKQHTLNYQNIDFSKHETTNIKVKDDSTRGSESLRKVDSLKEKSSLPAKTKQDSEAEDYLNNNPINEQYFITSEAVAINRQQKTIGEAIFNRIFNFFDNFFSWDQNERRNFRQDIRTPQEDLDDALDQILENS